MFTLRFDMRVPQWAGEAALHYAAAIEMCSWAETRGAVLAVLSEHHGAEDGHLPSPLLLASAIAARTLQLRILLAAVPIPLWDPVRLAEEIAVLDLISQGRVSYAFGLGHRTEEYEHFGVDITRRGRMADEYRGATVRVTPGCASSERPMMLVAGGSEAAARRAGRYGLGFISQSANPRLQECYEAACRKHGQQPGMVQFPVPGTPTTVFVSDDLERAWDELGPYLLHDAKMAASYRHGDDSVASITRARDIDDLRRDSLYRIFTPAQAVDHLRSGQLMALHPLCGGIPADVAWPYLKLAAKVTAGSR